MIVFICIFCEDQHIHTQIHDHTLHHPRCMLQASSCSPCNLRLCATGPTFPHSLHSLAHHNQVWLNQISHIRSHRMYLPTPDFYILLDHWYCCKWKCLLFKGQAVLAWTYLPCCLFHVPAGGHTECCCTLEYCGKCCNGRSWGMGINADITFPGLYTQKHDGWVILYIVALIVLRKKSLTVFHNGYTYLHSHHQCLRKFFAHWHLTEVWSFID